MPTPTQCRRSPALLAISDLHVESAENRRFTERLAPGHDGDWLIVGGDVGETMADVEWALATLARNFARVIWTPGNHELWTAPADPVQLRGDARYRHLVRQCQTLGIITPEDDYPVWTGPGGPVTIAALFTLYDYSFGANIADSREQALALAHRAGVVCSDELVLHPDPYPSREAWCRARIAFTERRLDAHAAAGSPPPVLVSHYPLIAELTRPLYHPEFAQWCGTMATAAWHTRYGAAAVVYGHLHIPRSTIHDGVRFEEVSFGYQRERVRWPHRRAVPAQILQTTDGR